MEEKLKVDELRAELSKRGLSNAGPKYTLVKRLKSHLEEENMLSVDTIDASVGEKRHKQYKANDSNDSKRIRGVEIEDLQQMGIRQLRQEAVLKGISVSGSKKELVERLCTDSSNNLKNISEGKEEDSTKEKKQVTGNTKRTAPLDHYLPAHIKAEYNFLKHEDEIYDAMLNQTNVGDNNNKFNVLAKPNPVMKNQLQLLELDPQTAKFMSLICNIDMMKQQMMGLGYNAKKLPLGKLSRSMILKGYDLLRRISDVIDQSSGREKLEQLSGEFYTIIPHDVGFHKMTLLLIRFEESSFTHDAKTLPLSGGFRIDNPYKLK